LGGAFMSCELSSRPRRRKSSPERKSNTAGGNPIQDRSDPNPDPRETSTWVARASTHPCPRPSHDNYAHRHLDHIDEPEDQAA
jgi:hypothetical protein